MPHYFLGKSLNNNSGKNNFKNVISSMGNTNNTNNINTIASAVPLQIKGHCEKVRDIS